MKNQKHQTELRKQESKLRQTERGKEARAMEGEKRIERTERHRNEITPNRSKKGQITLLQTLVFVPKQDLISMDLMDMMDILDTLGPKITLSTERNTTNSVMRKIIEGMETGAKRHGQ